MDGWTGKQMTLKNTNIQGKDKKNTAPMKIKFLLSFHILILNAPTDFLSFQFVWQHGLLANTPNSKECRDWRSFEKHPTMMFY